VAGRLGAYEAGAPADAARVRRGLVLDLAVAVVVTMLLWPFPFIRLTLALPVPVHVALILVAIVVVDILYMAVSVAVWGRTPVMYLLDLGLAGAARPFGAGRALWWAVPAALVALPAALGARSLADPVRGLPARASALRTVAAVEAAERA
jgi:hypothetical protein